jgi:hypothetical protein
MPTKFDETWRNRIAWLLIIALIFFSVLATAITNSRLADAQSGLIRSQDCTQQFLGATVNALNERTTYTTAQANANSDLQHAQLKFIATLANKKHTQSDAESAFTDYFHALKHYNTLVALSAGKADRFPYPTTDDYRACLHGG